MEQNESQKWADEIAKIFNAWFSEREKVLEEILSIQDVEILVTEEKLNEQRAN